MASTPREAWSSLLSASDSRSWTVFLAEAEQRLRAAGIESASIEARRIVEEASGYLGAEFVVGLTESATTRTAADFDAMVSRRLAGEPLQYVLGSWGFRALDLLVDQRVLIPRPETETVVDFALREIDRLADPDPEGVLTVVDVGTGSGAIALSLASERSRIEVWATDVSADAVEVARANLAGLGRAATRVRLCEGSWFDAIPDELQGGVDLIVSNPPYVAEGDDLPDEVSLWEPHLALVSGPSGFEALFHLVRGACQWLSKSGVLVLELAPSQAGPVVESALAAGFREAIVGSDLAGHDRVVVARR